MRILVCGGRDFNDWNKLELELNRIIESRYTNYDEIVIIEGGAKGADSLARDYADIYDLGHIKYPAQWGKYGNKAGPIRNQQMLDEGKPDLVVAFHGKPREDGKRTGTQHMVSISKKAGIKVIEVEYEG